MGKYSEMSLIGIIYTFFITLIRKISYQYLRGTLTCQI